MRTTHILPELTQERSTWVKVSSQITTDHFGLCPKCYTEGLRDVGAPVGRLGCAITYTRDSWKAYINGIQKDKTVVVNYITFS